MSRQRQADTSTESSRPAHWTVIDRTDFTPAQLREVKSHLKRGRRQIPVSDRKLLIGLHRAGLGYARRASDFEILFDEAVFNTPPRPELATRYLRLAESKTLATLVSLLQTFCADDPLMRTELRAQSRGWRSAGRTLVPLSQDAQSNLDKLGLPPDADFLREKARHMANFHKSKVGRGRKRMTYLDNTLIQLAELFAGLIGERDSFKLPHTETSYFVAFAAAALAPFPRFRQSRSQRAVSRRWKRLKAAEDQTKIKLTSLEAALKSQKSRRKSQKI